MKVAGVRELRTHMAALMGGTEPVLVTRHGKVSGVYLPLERPDEIPTDLRRELAVVLGRHLDRLLNDSEVSEEEIQRDFDEHRCGRRRR